MNVTSALINAFSLWRVSILLGEVEKAKIIEFCVGQKAIRKNSSERKGWKYVNKIQTNF